MVLFLQRGLPETRADAPNSSIGGAKLQHKSESLVVESEDEIDKVATKLVHKVPIKKEEILF
jgi:hypothetical protein